MHVFHVLERRPSFHRYGKSHHVFLSQISCQRICRGCDPARFSNVNSLTSEVVGVERTTGRHLISLSVVLVLCIGIAQATTYRIRIQNISNLKSSNANLTTIRGNARDSYSFHVLNRGIVYFADVIFPVTAGKSRVGLGPYRLGGRGQGPGLPTGWLWPKMANKGRWLPPVSLRFRKKFGRWWVLEARLSPLQTFSTIRNFQHHPGPSSPTCL